MRNLESLCSSHCVLYSRGVADKNVCRNSKTYCTFSPGLKLETTAIGKKIKYLEFFFSELAKILRITLVVAGYPDRWTPGQLLLPPAIHVCILILYRCLVIGTECCDVMLSILMLIMISDKSTIA